MYQLTLDDSKQLHVHYKNHVVSYGVDGSLPNPLEATYAAIAGCAGVYAKKACKALGISADGMAISCKPVVRNGSLLIPSRFVTEVQFPDHFTAEQRERVIAEINQCAVKQLIHQGESVDFLTNDAAANS